MSLRINIYIFCVPYLLFHSFVSGVLQVNVSVITVAMG